MARNILLIEDNADLAHLLPLHLEDLKCTVEAARDGVIGLRKALTGRHDLIILDLVLPEIDGIELCQRVRRERITTPILMLTSKSSELDRVLGLEVGDDPRDPDLPKAFSAAPIEIDGRLSGYLYVVLGGEAYRSATSMFEGSQILRLSLLIIIAGLALAMALGAFRSHLLARRLRHLAGTMAAFADADFRHAAEPFIPARSGGGDEIDALIETFNVMAGKIHQQFSTLEAIDESRRELIMHISHDLNTPLATLNGYLETLMIKGDQLDPAERQACLDSSLTFSRHLGRMIADLFELAQLDTAEAPLRKETFSMDELVQDVCMRFQPEAKSGGIALDASIEAPGNFVHADIRLIERTLANLIDNAIKFTPSGGRVRLAVEQHDDDVVTRVADTGLGMAESELANIFDRFYRIDHLRKKTNGTGLGLAIARRIVELHDGRIDVASRVGEGATLTFRLPAALPLSG